MTLRALRCWLVRGQPVSDGTYEIEACPIICYVTVVIVTLLDVLRLVLLSQVIAAFRAVIAP